MCPYFLGHLVFHKANTVSVNTITIISEVFFKKMFSTLMMIEIASNSHPRQKEGARVKGEEEAKDQIKGVQKRNSHRSILVRVMGCEGQEKIQTDVQDSPPQEGQRKIGISYIHLRQQQRDLQKDKWIWESEFLQNRGRFAYSAAHCGEAV